MVSLSWRDVSRQKSHGTHIIVITRIQRFCGLEAIVCSTHNHEKTLRERVGGLTGKWLQRMWDHRNFSYIGEDRD